MADYSEWFILRQSCRAFADTPVGTEDLLACVKAARLAPSAHNSQPYSFVIVNNRDAILKMAPCFVDGTYNTWCHQCQAFLLVLEEEVNFPGKKDHFSAVGIGMAVMSFCLAAVEKGLGTCVLGAFDENRIRKIVAVASTGILRLVIGIGYPRDPAPQRRMRKSLAQLVQVVE